MKKGFLLVLAAMLALLPTAGGAEGIPELLSAVQEGIGEGLAAGARQTEWAMDGDLTLTLFAGDEDGARIEEGQHLTLTLTAGNPRPVDTPVTIELHLPQRLGMATDAAWQAVLPAAKADPETGALVPSLTVFSREIALAPGGTSEEVTLEAEMSMGTRFYRARIPLSICVSDVSATAQVAGTEEGRAHLGDALTYRVEVTNAGMAAKDVPVELILPDGVALSGELPDGFTLTGRRLSGQVRAEAACLDDAGTAASLVTLEVPVTIEADALSGDADATRLLAASLRVDGQRIAMPRVQLCAPRVSAQLIAESSSLEIGEETTLRILVVNSGLAEADVRLTCVLPEGLTLAEEESGRSVREATAAEASMLPPEEDDGAQTAGAVLSQAPQKLDNGALLYTLRMPAAEEGDSGVCAATSAIRLRVRAEEPQENLRERLLGASLAWDVDGGEAQLGEAVALRVHSAAFLGLTRGEWNGVFWSALLLAATIACLCAAVRSDKSDEEYSFE